MAGVDADTSPFLDRLTSRAWLEDAWRRVSAAHGGPGCDGMTIERYRATAAPRLAALSQRIRGGLYVASPLRRAVIPKPDGGFRILGIPTVDDRVVQTAAAGLLIELFEPEFSAASFAYRPGLGPKQAATRLASVATRDRWVVIADIEKFFDNVDHAVLFAALRTKGVDEAAIRYLQTWLLAPSQDRETRYQPMKGLPQGTPVAPILANIYLTQFDRALEVEAWTHVRYADDFVVISGGQDEAEHQLRFIRTWLRRERHLSLKDAKTLYTSVASGFSFVGFWFDGEGRSLSSDRMGSFKATLSQILSDGGREQLSDCVKRHNDLVVGWRNYYGGLTERLDEQLHEFDRWRSDCCRDYLARIGVDPALGELCFALLAPSRAAGVDGAYPEWDQPSEPGLTALGETAGPLDEAGATSAGRQDRPFSTSRALRAREIAARQSPVVFGEGTLWIPTFGSFVTMSKAVLMVKLKKQIVFECPINTIDQIVVEADGVAVSSRTVTACAAHRVPLVFCRNSGLPVARLVPGRADLIPGLADQQVSARNTTTGAAIVAEMLAAKIRNQRALLLRTAKYARRSIELRARLHAAADKLAGFADRCPAIASTGDTEWRKQMLLAEARAAAWYWHAFRALVPKDLAFSRRHGRGAHDIVNVLLNYGYWFLYRRVWLAVERSGLHPFVGLLHTGRGKTPGLVLDLMEEFRQPAVDQAVLALIGRRAALRLNERGRLSLRSRRIAQHAFIRAGMRRDRRMSLFDRVVHQAAHLEQAFRGTHPYTGYRSRW